MTCCDCDNPDVEQCREDVYFCPECGVLMFRSIQEAEQFIIPELTPEQIAAIDSIPF